MTDAQMMGSELEVRRTSLSVHSSLAERPRGSNGTSLLRKERRFLCAVGPKKREAVGAHRALHVASEILTPPCGERGS